MAKLLETLRIVPFTDESPEYSFVSEFSLPLTLFDTFWFKFPPVERLFFYNLAESKQTFLNSVIPKLKHSLSLTLRHFLPVAGTLTWPKDSPKPIIRYQAPNDAVSFSIAESKPDLFDVLSGDQPREALQFHSLVPKLSVSETAASVLSLQVTLFPGKGFCIGVTSHHAVLDGKSTTMFLKSWAHFCREVNATSIPEELTPVFDRSSFKDPKGLDMLFLNHWSTFEDPRRDTKLFEHLPLQEVSPEMFRMTFKLSCSDIAKLRKDISLHNGSEKLRLTSFVVAISYAFQCIIAAETDEKVFFGFAADFRRRMREPVPENYFGNCVGILAYPNDAKELIIAGQGRMDSVAAVATEVEGLVRKLDDERDVMEGADKWLSRFGSIGKARGLGVAGSPRFRVYGVDFGWGPPNKVEIVSIDRSGAVSLAETRGGIGGVEIGLVLDKHQILDFTSTFVHGLEIQNQISNATFA